MKKPFLQSGMAALAALARSMPLSNAKPPSKSSLKREERYGRREAVPVRPRSLTELETMADNLRNHHVAMNVGRPRFKKLCTNPKKLRRQVRRQMQGVAHA